jgi:hypothetical protein
MRVSSTEIEKIKAAIYKFLPAFNLFLHGSRINDQLKGGDIDLFLVVPDQEIQGIKSKKHYLDAELSLALEDQRIDVTIISVSAVGADVFFLNSEKVEI